MVKRFSHVCASPTNSPTRPTQSAYARAEPTRSQTNNSRLSSMLLIPTGKMRQPVVQSTLDPHLDQPTGRPLIGFTRYQFRDLIHQTFLITQMQMHQPGELICPAVIVAQLHT